MKEKEEKISKALMFVKTTSLTPYRIAQDTKITEATIGNYKNGKTKPTLANAEILIRYFEEINNLEIDISGLNKQTRDTNNDTRPRIPYDAAAGTLTDTVNGVAEISLSRSLRGNPTLDTLERIATALNVPITELFNAGTNEELTALIQHKGDFYKACTIAELENIVGKIKEKQ